MTQQPPGPPPAPLNLSDQLNRAVAMVTATNQVVWNIFGIFWAANAVLLIALFPQGSLPKPAVGMVVSAFGVALALAWALILLRALKFLGFYEDVLANLESSLNVPPGLSLSSRRNEALFKEKIWRGVRIRVRPIQVGCALVSLVVWVFAFVIFLI